MNSYDNHFNSKEGAPFPWKIASGIVLFLIILSVVGFGIRSALLLGDTVMERKVFENSYQRQEAIKSEIAVNKAALIEIGMKLNNPKLDADTRFNLEAQASAARIRIATAQRRVK